ncbi:MAG: hypothetical protein GY772_14195 [bacterium]|nr:hypothetical protein [bacterium]
MSRKHQLEYPACQANITSPPQLCPECLERASDGQALHYSRDPVTFWEAIDDEFEPELDLEEDIDQDEGSSDHNAHVLPGPSPSLPPKSATTTPPFRPQNADSSVIPLGDR